MCLDAFERVFVAFLFAWLLFNMLEDILNGDSPELVIFLAVEFMLVICVVSRRLTMKMTTDPFNWALAYLGTSFPLLVAPSTYPPLIPGVWCIALALTGVICQLSGKITLNRCFGVVAANRGVKTTGLYGLVRHPIYLGYTISHAGFLLFAPSAWNALVYALTLSLQIGRIHAEERFLQEDAAYLTYVNAVRYRLIPGIF